MRYYMFLQNKCVITIWKLELWVHFWEIKCRDLSGTKRLRKETLWNNWTANIFTIKYSCPTYDFINISYHQYFHAIINIEYLHNIFQNFVKYFEIYWNNWELCFCLMYKIYGMSITQL